jgi:hypothetical protein
VPDRQESYCLKEGAKEFFNRLGYSQKFADAKEYVTGILSMRVLVRGQTQRRLGWA